MAGHDKDNDNKVLSILKRFDVGHLFQGIDRQGPAPVLNDLFTALDFNITVFDLLDPQHHLQRHGTVFVRTVMKHQVGLAGGPLLGLDICGSKLSGPFRLFHGAQFGSPGDN